MPTVSEKLITTLSKCKTIYEKIKSFNDLKEFLTKEIIVEREKHEAKVNELSYILDSNNQ